MIVLRKSPAFVGSLLGTALVGITYLAFNGIPKYFSGDDFLLLESSRRPDGYASTLIGCVNDVGMGKWRPMFTCSVAPLLKMIGANYLWFFLLNHLLMFLISFVAGNLLREFIKISGWQIAVCSFALPCSRFAWYSRISPYGLMELGALLFALLFVRQYISALDQQKSTSWYLAGGLASLSGLFHERYLVLLLAGFLVALFNFRSESVRIPVSPWFAFACLLFFIKVNLLDTDPLVGGGETSLRSSFDSWIVEHFVVGMKAIAGIGNGTNINFDASGYIRMQPLGLLANLWTSSLVFAAFVLGTFKYASQRDTVILRTDMIEKPFRRTAIKQLLVVSGLLLVVPASTIVSRIEGRWLYGPEVFLFVLTIVALNSARLRAVFSISFIAFSLSCLVYLPRFEQPSRIANQILLSVNKELQGRTDLVYAIRDPRSRPELANWLDWVLGLDSKFKQIGVDHAVIVKPSECYDSCISLHFADTDVFEFTHT